MEELNSVGLTSIVMSILFATGISYIGWRAEQLRSAMSGREGATLMLVLARIISVTAAASWVTVARVMMLNLWPEGTETYRAACQTLSQGMFFGVLVWALVRVQSFRLEGREDQSTWRRELDRAERIVRKGT